MLYLTALLSVPIKHDIIDCKRLLKSQTWQALDANSLDSGEKSQKVATSIKAVESLKIVKIPESDSNVDKTSSINSHFIRHTSIWSERLVQWAFWRHFGDKTLRSRSCRPLREKRCKVSHKWQLFKKNYGHFIKNVCSELHLWKPIILIYRSSRERRTQQRPTFQVYFESSALPSTLRQNQSENKYLFEIITGIVIISCLFTN